MQQLKKNKNKGTSFSKEIQSKCYLATRVISFGIFRSFYQLLVIPKNIKITFLNLPR